MPMGLYRSPKAASAEAPYVFVNPPANTYLHREVPSRMIDYFIKKFLVPPFNMVSIMNNGFALLDNSF
jgi:hypothetical protein